MKPFPVIDSKGRRKPPLKIRSIFRGGVCGADEGVNFVSLITLPTGCRLSPPLKLCFRGGKIFSLLLQSQIQAKSQFCAVCPYLLLTQHGVKRTSCEQHGVLFAHAELRNRLFQRRFRDRRQRTTLALPRRDGELTRTIMVSP